MSTSDPIADMLNRIRNAHMAGADFVELPHSKMKSEVARILKREGYVREVVVEGTGAARKLRLFLKYQGDGQPTIRGLKRISRPGLRHYTGAGKLPRVLGGMGVAIISTPAGIVTDQEARQLKVGGEVLCYVW